MINLILISTSKSSLDLYFKFLKLVFKKLRMKYTFSGILLRKRRMTLLKSPHVYKKSKESFEVSTFKLLISVNFSNNPTTLKFILQNKPKSVTLKFKR